MKKLQLILIAFLLVLGLSACGEQTVTFDVSFDSNGGTIIASVETDGSSIIIPDNPEKEGYVFDGWYWDNGTFEDPFTLASLQEAPLDSDMTVYAKWSEISVSLITQQLMTIWTLTVEAGEFDGTYEDWLETVRGPEGLPGEDGREVTFQVANNYIQWQYVGDTTWINLLSLDAITGQDGTDGINGTNGTDGTDGVDGQDGQNGLSAYEIYLQYFPDYTGDEQTWIMDLISGELYEAPQWDITFIYNDGITEDLVVQIEHETTITEPSVPTRDGYTFLGWFHNNLEWNFLGSVVVGTMTLEARWEENSTYEGNIPTVLPTTEAINLVFWNVYGESKQALLDVQITAFENMMLNEYGVNVNIESVSKGDYTSLRNSVILGINNGTTPDLVIGYPDHFAQYVQADALIPLNAYVNDETWGVDVNDFIPSYMEENQQYTEGALFSFPFSKSTEILMYNKDIFAANGITVPEDGSITWAMLDTWADTLVGTGPNQCEYLINYDSPSNFFINNIRMWDGGYTNTDGEILVANTNTIAMMDYVAQRFADNTFALPLAWNEAYGSNNFIAQNVCMTVGSTAGINYNIPSNYGTSPEDYFEVGVAPIPQYDLNNKSAVQQGPNIAIMSNTTDTERLVSWLLISWLTNTENTAAWAMQTGYLPVRYSAYNSSTYQAFLNTSSSSDPYYYESLAAKAGMQQIDYFNYEPAFAGSITSSDARTQAEFAMEALFAGNETLSIIQTMLINLGSELNITAPDSGDGGPALLLSVDGIINTDITLPDYVSGSPITWSSSHPSIISTTGDVTLPPEGGGSVVVTLTATFTYESVDYTRTFDIVVQQAPPVNNYTSISDIYAQLVLGDLFGFSGVVSSFFGGGYVLTDGTNMITVYNPSSSLDLEVGDYVGVYGELAKYYSAYQISNVQYESLLTESTTITIPTSTASSVSDLLALDSTNPLIHGQSYTVTATIIEYMNSSGYVHLYLYDGTDMVMINYNSPNDSLLVLEGHIGDTITIDVVYYTDHGINGPMVTFDGEESDIIVVSTFG